MWVKPKSKTLWIELEDIDWLCSYAADQHHFQATADSKNAVAATSIEWDFIGRAWDVKLMRQSYHIPRDIMTDAMYDKLADAYFGGHDQGSQRYQSALRRKACHKLLDMWCEATMAGKQQEFENAWDCQIQSRATRCNNDTHGDSAIDVSPSEVSLG